MDMIKTFKDSPDILANMLELWNNETQGILENRYYRNMTQLKKTFDYTDEELFDSLGDGFNFNHKYFYTNDYGYIFSSDEKDYTYLINDDPYLFKLFLEWLNESD